MINLNKDNIRVRNLNKNDLSMILKWLTDDRVTKYYGGRDIKRTPETIRKHYYEDDIETITRLIVEYEGKPIGYVQVCNMLEEDYCDYQYEKTGELVYSMDQFIGEPDYWNKGIGTKFMKMILDYLKEERKAKAVILDPHKNNPRAIRAYEKAGFKIIKDLPKHEMHEGIKEDCYLMECRLD